VQIFLPLCGPLKIHNLACNHPNFNIEILTYTKSHTV
jgi:hypothetical protein